jgi:D-alanyl-D-alanine carboxypeptidase
VLLRGHRPAPVPPGTRYHYSNTDNIVVALMAEQPAGQPYDALLSSLVFSPLGLNQTSLPEGYRLPSPYTHGYNNEGTTPDDVSTLLTASSAWASGGLVSRSS